MNLPIVISLLVVATACVIIINRRMNMVKQIQSNANSNQNNSYSAVDLKCGEDGIVSTVIGDETIRQRLASMGIMAGTVITSPTSSDFSDPRTYMVRGYQLCMRTSEASMILLQPEE